jgi:hypothetical protein
MILTGLVTAALALVAHGAPTNDYFRCVCLNPRRPFHPNMSNYDISISCRKGYNDDKVVKGVVFDRYISIWLENTDFAGAANDRELKRHEIVGFEGFR